MPVEAEGYLCLTSLLSSTGTSHIYTLECIYKINFSNNKIQPQIKWSTENANIQTIFPQMMYVKRAQNYVFTIYSTVATQDVPAKTVLYGEPQVPPLSMLKTDKVLKKFSAYLENLPPLPEVNSFGGGLKVETILDMVQNTSHDSFLLIKFKNKDEPELIPLDLALQKVPYLLSKFYKEYVCPCLRKF